MNYDTHTPEQIQRELAYCDQQLARTTSAERIQRMRRKRELLREALARKVVRGQADSNVHGAGAW